MAYLYVRHRGKHLLAVGVLVLCNKSENLPLERRRVGRLSIAGPCPGGKKLLKRGASPAGGRHRCGPWLLQNRYVEVSVYVRACP